MKYEIGDVIFTRYYGSMIITDVVGVNEILYNYYSVKEEDSSYFYKGSLFDKDCIKMKNIKLAFKYNKLKGRI